MRFSAEFKEGEEVLTIVRNLRDLLLRLHAFLLAILCGGLLGCQSYHRREAWAQVKNNPTLRACKDFVSRNSPSSEEVREAKQIIEKYEQEERDRQAKREDEWKVAQDVDTLESYVKYFEGAEKERRSYQGKTLGDPHYEAAQNAIMSLLKVDDVIVAMRLSQSCLNLIDEESVYRDVRSIRQAYKEKIISSLKSVNMIENNKKYGVTLKIDATLSEGNFKYVSFSPNMRGAPGIYFEAEMDVVANGSKSVFAVLFRGGPDLNGHLCVDKSKSAFDASLMSSMDATVAVFTRNLQNQQGACMRKKNSIENSPR